MLEKYGWFRYGRHPEGKVGRWTLTRSPGDPAIVVWRVGDDEWIIDDVDRDQHVQVDGFTEPEIRAALAFAQIMGWITVGAEIPFKKPQAWS
jgi:hypothetical protein